MKVRFLLGPAGSGKTFRCLAEVRQALSASPEGKPLLLIAPKQTTYQLERQFLADPSIAGYARLHILSFERLAYFVFDRLQAPPPPMLDEEGRVMVLRALLAQKRDDLELFRASARLTGFAQQLSKVLGEFQRHQLTPEALHTLAGNVPDIGRLDHKLRDLATLLRDYLAWLAAHGLKDADCLLAAATEALQENPKGETQHREPLPVGGLWVDGFAELSAQELAFLAALLPGCQQATITFCLEQAPSGKSSWLSGWTLARKSFEECKRLFASQQGVEVVTEIIARHPGKCRFLNNAVLLHLEQFWSEPRPFPAPPVASPDGLLRSVRLATCLNPEAEATLAAHEILRHVRAGGRFREVTVLVRQLDGYHQALRRIFSRHEIPFFLDRREPMSHHPLAELTRSAVRTLVSQWRREDWFAALKTGLVPAEDEEIDRLENEALARGWQGSIWQKPILVPAEPELSAWLAELHRRLLPPFQKLALALATHQNKPTGRQLAVALREFWSLLGIEQQLQAWGVAEGAGADPRLPGSVHATVWDQMNRWLGNLKLAFPTQALPLRQWLPILDAGLANLDVGVIPPALDQVLIGAIDRSRNPDIKLALVLGLNESVFPALPEPSPLLTEMDRAALEQRGVALTNNLKPQLARERFFAYIACTRARERLVLTCALNDADGSPLNPSPFLTQIRALFPSLPCENVPKTLDWREAEHVHALIGPVLRARTLASETDRAGHEPARARHVADPAGGLAALERLPVLAAVLERIRHFAHPESEATLAPELAARLYGPVLRTSVSRMEQFAACPFRFFFHSGLRAEERKKFELDVKEQGTFQHDVLAYFHEELRREHLRWRDLTPEAARARIGKIAGGLMASYRDGLLQATEQTRFMARILTESLQDFVETLVGWIRHQYLFDPLQVELPFGAAEGSPAWSIALADGARLAVRGRIDRVDIFRDPATGEGYCVVVDYKSSQKRLDPVLMAHGLQLQLLTYLEVLRHWPNPRESFGVDRLVPAGVFYVNLRGRYERSQNRLEALGQADQDRRLAYRHAGRFDARVLPWLDSRRDVSQGDQFNYRRNKDGTVNKSCREPLATADFAALLDSVEQNLKRMGGEIFAGAAKVSPYRKGTQTACSQCEYQAICRIDPWTHQYRVLAPPKPAAPQL